MLVFIISIRLYLTEVYTHLKKSGLKTTWLKTSLARNFSSAGITATSSSARAWNSLASWKFYEEKHVNFCRLKNCSGFSDQ
jgi:hypothetical protein